MCVSPRLTNSSAMSTFLTRLLPGSRNRKLRSSELAIACIETE
jgi:hypothetical protein